ncbi:MAG: uroporphyrinogen decarboxylase family protein [Pirellulales bacterium]|nr:uroporphyrinogen decarboxylase family protein [Pirellulales bacterium]
MSLRLIDWVTESPRPRVVPLAGFPGMQLTESSVKQNMFNAELQARSIYKLMERVRPDAAFVMMDLSVEAGALGLPVRFPLDESATVEMHPVETVADLDQYKVVDPMYDGRVWVFRETVRLLKQLIDMPIGVYVSGPFTLAGLMMGANDVALAVLDVPEVVHAAVNFCEHVVIEYAKSLQRAGADMICVLDPTAMMLSPTMFWEFAGKSEQNVFRHLDTRTILHVCGNTTHLVEKMCETGTHALSFDSLVDLPAVAPRVPSDVVIMGNVDPVSVMLQGNREKVRRATTELMEAMRGYDNFLISTGCDLPPETPLENIVELVQTARRFER